MKKIFLIPVSILLFSAASFAQNLKIIRIGGNTALNDSTITLYGTTSTTLLSAIVYVVNTSTSLMNVKCKRDTISVVPGTSNYFCWVSCYPPNVNVSPTALSMPPNDTAKGFYGDYKPTGLVGTTTIRYVFFNSANPNDSSWILVKFIVTPVGIAQLSSTPLSISAPYPNPTNEYANFEYHVTGAAYLTLYNSLGQAVEKISLSPTKTQASLNVVSLPAGIYICRVESANATPVYQRLIISH